MLQRTTDNAPMLTQGMGAFKNKRVLLLQGPVGPFFARLAQDLRAEGATVHKVNFHAGDWWFYRRDSVWFTGPMPEWPAFLNELIDRWQIDALLLYGDCRPVHALAHGIAIERGLDVGVFEEGYLRPNHITLERNGVNGHSDLPRDPQAYLSMPELPEVAERQVGNTFWHMVWWGFWYFTVGGLVRPFQRHTVHHRHLSILEALPWLRSVWRKQWYRWTERKAMPTLMRRWSGAYFLMPLQVHNDAQIRVHSAFETVEHAIETVMRSFAAQAPNDTALVIKHHPMDRGYVEYTALIGRLQRALGLQGRCFYIHDQHLPTLLDHARGAVVVNSTVGLQALRHGVPLKVLGDAIYNMPGLSFQGSLGDFWQKAPNARPQPKLLRQFVRFLKTENQINGSFFKPLPNCGWHSGLAWPAEPREADIAVSQPMGLALADARPPQTGQADDSLPLVA